MNEGKRKILVALGGNALEPVNGDPTAQGQLKAVREAAVHIADLIEMGNDVIISHGNGPQVGRILLQNEAAKDITPTQPVDSCVAMTQGAIGYHIQNAMREELYKRGINKQVVSLITQVEVDGEDSAFNNPTKPIGPFLSKEQAESEHEEKGYIYKEDSGRGWRRVIASPKPKRIIEADSISTLMDAGAVVIVAGGGGIPVVEHEDGVLEGVEAVIDKDLTSSLLADRLLVDDLFILTAVPKAALNFGKENQTLLDVVDVITAMDYCDDGHFAPGSMLPKIKAAISFAKENPQRRSIITSLECAKQAYEEKNGTIIVK